MSDAVPVERHEDDLVIPIVEERPVVEEVLVKRMFLKEELRITRTSTLEPAERDVTLRVMHADVQRSCPPLNRQKSFSMPRALTAMFSSRASAQLRRPPRLGASIRTRSSKL